LLVNGQNPLHHHGETVVNGLETLGNESAKADAGDKKVAFTAFVEQKRRDILNVVAADESASW
jgi:hypothetical protein